VRCAGSVFGCSGCSGLLWLQEAREEITAPLGADAAAALAQTGARRPCRNPRASDRGAWAAANQTDRRRGLGSASPPALPAHIQNCQVRANQRQTTPTTAQISSTIVVTPKLRQHQMGEMADMGGHGRPQRCLRNRAHRGPSAPRCTRPRPLFCSSAPRRCLFSSFIATKISFPARQHTHFLVSRRHFHSFIPTVTHLCVLLLVLAAELHSACTLSFT
jgi:hypothetical protein